MENIKLSAGLSYLVKLIIKKGITFNNVIVGEYGVEVIRVLKETESAYKIQTENRQKLWILKTDKVEVVEQLTYGDPIPGPDSLYNVELESNPDKGCSCTESLECYNCGHKDSKSEKEKCTCGPDEVCSNCP